MDTTATTTVIDNPFTASVAEAGAWLDTEYPGWLTRVDLDRLRMSDGDWCLMAQVTDEHFTYFMGEMEERGMVGTHVQNKFCLFFRLPGFPPVPGWTDTDWPESHRQRTTAMEQLDRAWRDYINARRTASLLEA